MNCNCEIYETCKHCKEMSQHINEEIAERILEELLKPWYSTIHGKN